MPLINSNGFVHKNGREVHLKPLEDGRFEIELVRPFSPLFTQGLKTKEIRSGKVRQLAQTIRQGERVSTSFIISRDIAESLMILLDHTLEKTSLKSRVNEVLENRHNR